MPEYTAHYNPIANPIASTAANPLSIPVANPVAMTEQLVRATVDYWAAMSYPAIYLARWL